MSMVGALNVGSVLLHFDDKLRTNEAKGSGRYYLDKNYVTLGETDGSFTKYPIRIRSQDDSA